mgnify:CR=1 FL=1
MKKKKITQEELEALLRKHKLWLENKEGGERADLREANFQEANFQGADLRRANLRRASLQGANLQGADLQEANFQGADLDCSCLPLWCGSLSANFDDRQLVQIAYHLVKAGLNSINASEDTKKELAKLIDFANKFHRVDECGLIERSNNNAE